MPDNRPIGVFDSGLGGLTVVRELNRVLPNENIVYFGDTGRVPYGTRSSETIKRYAKEDAEFLLSQDVKMIVAACGTVSSVAGDILKALPVPFFEVVSHSAKQAANTTKNGVIGVLGTGATIKSERHKQYIKEILPDAAVVSSGCTLFVPLVEEGWYADDDVMVLEAAKRYLKPILEAKADTVILGCTHYPVLKGAISSILGSDVRLINSGTATSLAIRDFLNENDMLNEGKRFDDKFFVSDKPEFFKDFASVLLGKNINNDDIKKVEI